MVVGRERGESGTPHLQGYFHLRNQISFAALKRFLPALHFERARGSGLQNQAYCTKDGDFFEIGELPKEKSTSAKETWNNILSAAESGNWKYIKLNHPRVWISFREKLISMRIPSSIVLDGDTQNEWWVGPTGCGKSRLAWEKYGSICYQKMLNKWWDGYDAQPVVVIEEWSPKNEVTASALKIWADRYPFTAQIKGGVLQKIRPQKIIVISNYRIDDCFPDERDRHPIRRRFREKEFPRDLDQTATEADKFLEALNSDDSTTVDVDDDMSNADADLPSDLLSDLLVDDESATLLPAQSWVDYASDSDFNRIMELDQL